MKKLLLRIQDIRIDYSDFSKFYADMLLLSQKDNKNIDQLLIDVNNRVIYCYGLPTVKTLLA